MHTFGINGFGRIGRTSLRVWWQYHRDEIALGMINTSGSMDLEGWVQLLRYDTNYGRFQGEISFEEHQGAREASDADPLIGTLVLTDPMGRPGEVWRIPVTAQRDPSKLPWEDHGVSTVIESTGVFRDDAGARKHIDAGAQRVIISAPAKGAIKQTVLGVEDLQKNHDVISNASCTTNCVAPVMQLLHQHIGVESAFLTTIHSYTDSQNLHDNSHKDPRRARAAAENLVPTTTGAAKATTDILTDLQGRFDGMAVRVPTPTGSLSDIVFHTEKEVTREAINEIFREAARQPRWEHVLAVTDEPIVSSDIVGRRESSIVDLEWTNVMQGHLVKVVSWYDNEFGYCNRLIEQTIGLSS